MTEETKVDKEEYTDGESTWAYYKKIGLDREKRNKLDRMLGRPREPDWVFG